MNHVKTGKLIAECRRERHYTQAELAEKLGVTDKSVSKWECGRSMPNSSIYEALCRELNISVGELLAGEKSNGENQQQINNETILEIVRLYEKMKDHKNVLIGAVIVVLGGLYPVNFETTSAVGSFFQGCSLGLSVGMKIVGFLWVVYGIAKASLNKQT